MFEIGDDLLDDGMVAVGGFGVEHRFGVVGKHRVIAVGGEQLVLPGGCGGGVEPADPPDDQSGADPLGFATAGERGERRFGDLGIGNPALFLFVVDRIRVADRYPRGLVDPGDRLVTAGVSRAVMENRASARRAAVTMS